jgi:hypothetical protein
MIVPKNIELIVNLFFDSSEISKHKINFSNELLFFLRENKIMIRYFQLLSKHNSSLSIDFKNEYNKELNRIKTNRKMIASITASLRNYQKDFIFFKNFQHSPDMGDDIDVMVLKNFSDIKNKLINDFSLIEKKPTVFNRLARKCMLIDSSRGIEIELHNGRLGRLGEFKFSNDEINLCKKDEEMIYVPLQEFQLVINVIQRLYTRSYIRISEILFLKLNLSKNFDWNLVYNIAKKFGVLKGLDLYLTLIDSLFIQSESGKKSFSLNSVDKAIFLKNSLLYLEKFQIAPLFILKQFKRY